MGLVKRIKNALYAFRESGALFTEFRDPDEHLFRNISRDGLFRDISSLKRERTLNIAYTLYLAYPLARRAMEIKKDFIVGEGITFKAENEGVHEVLQKFWDDPVNDWDMKQDTKALEIGLYGEQFYQAFVNEANGHVRLGYIDPLQVKQVITNPDNVEEPMAIKVIDKRAPDGVKILKVIRIDNKVDSKSFGKLTGDVFFFAINKVANATRGNSDLLPVADWIELDEQFLMKIHEAAHIRTQFAWNVTVKGATAKQLRELAANWDRIKAGNTRFLNEMVNVSPAKAELETQDMAEHHAIFKRHIAAGLGLPDTWLSESGANKASAEQMATPTTKHLRSRQRFFLNMIRRMMDYCIDQAILAGTLKDGVNRNFKVMAPQIWPVDSQRLTSALLVVAQALQTAQSNGWMEEGEAAELFKFIAAQLGMDLRLSGGKGEVSGKDEEGTDPAEFEGKHAAIIRKLGDKLANGVKGRPPGHAPALGDLDPELANQTAFQLNGAQIASLLKIVDSVASRKLPLESAVMLLAATFPSLNKEEARKMLEEVLRAQVTEAT